MNCPTCGATLTDGTTICPTCGATISQPADFNQMQYQQPETNFNQAQYQQPQANYNQQPYQQPQANFNQAQYQQPQANYNQAQYQQPQANYNQMPYANSAAYAPAGAKYKRKFNAGHFAVMGGSLLCLISVFLPFLSVSLSESMSLFKDGEDGVIFLITAIVIIALSMLRVNTLNIILTLIQGIFAIYETMSAKSELSDYGSMVQYGAGFYLLLIGGIVAFVGAIIGLVLHINAKKAFNQA